MNFMPLALKTRIARILVGDGMEYFRGRQNKELIKADSKAN